MEPRSRVQGIVNNNLRQEDGSNLQEIIIIILFFNVEQVSSIEKHYPFKSGDPAEHCVLGFLFSLVVTVSDGYILCQGTHINP